MVARKSAAGFRARFFVYVLWHSGTALAASPDDPQIYFAGVLR